MSSSCFNGRKSDKRVVKELEKENYKIELFMPCMHIDHVYWIPILRQTFYIVCGNFRMEFVKINNSAILNCYEWNTVIFDSNCQVLCQFFKYKYLGKYLIEVLNLTSLNPALSNGLRSWLQYFSSSCVCTNRAQQFIRQYRKHKPWQCWEFHIILTMN